jgi:hypothetical protein
MPHTDGSASSTVPLLLSCSGHGLLLIASTRSQTFLGENILTYTRDPLEIQRTSTRRSMMVRLWVSALREARIFEPIVLAGGGRGSPALVLKNLGQHRLAKEAFYSKFIQNVTL